MGRKHRFKTSRGETFCIYCGITDDDAIWSRECRYYTIESPHNFVKMKPDNYRKYTVSGVLVFASENVEKLNKTFEDKFNVSIVLTQDTFEHNGDMVICVRMDANRKGDIKAASKYIGIWAQFEDNIGPGGYSIISNPISYEIKCNRCLREGGSHFGCS